jgi:hypothetical protein
MKKLFIFLLLINNVFCMFELSNKLTKKEEHFADSFIISDDEMPPVSNEERRLRKRPKKEFPFYCSIGGCGAGFKDQRYLDIHEDGHIEASMAVKKLVPSTKVALKIAMAAKKDEVFKSDQGKYPCLEPGCNKKFVTLGSRHNHVKSDHLGIRYICSECSVSYTRRDRLDKHEAIRHQ